MAHGALDWIFLIIVYTIITIVNIYAVFLYRIACYKMRRTKMIQSVYYLLAALLVENLYFWLASLIRAINHGVSSFLELPYLWAIPKLLLLVGLIYFIIASLTPTEELVKDCKDMEKINKHLKDIKS